MTATARAKTQSSIQVSDTVTGTQVVEPLSAASKEARLEAKKLEVEPGTLTWDVSDPRDQLTTLPNTLLRCHRFNDQNRRALLCTTTVMTQI